MKNELCGQCVWLFTPQGTAKLSCSEKSSVITSLSPACKDFTVKSFDISEIKATDQFLLKLRKRLKSKCFVIDPSLKDELSSYFVVSQEIKTGGKKLKGTLACSYGPQEAAHLISLFEETQALRDRSLAIKMGLQSLMVDLKNIEALGRQYIYEHFGSYFQNMKSETIRETVISSLLAPLGSVVLKVEHVIGMADSVYSNLKDTYFVLKEIKDLACNFLMSTRLEK
jgi:hypothetical protein